MAKTTYLKLDLVNDPLSPNISQKDWVKSQNGVGDTNNLSNAQLIDLFAGKFSGGLVGQKLKKKSNTNFDFEWVDDPININFTIPQDTTWNPLQNSDPYKFSASITISNSALGDVNVECYFNELIPSSNSGITLSTAVDSSSDIVLTFYAIKQPTAQISGKVVVVNA